MGTSPFTMVSIVVTSLFSIIEQSYFSFVHLFPAFNPDDLGFIISHDYPQVHLFLLLLYSVS